MSSLICEEDIVKELEQFNIKLEDKDILTKLKNICLIYDFNAEKLVGEWLGFCSKKTWSTDIDMAKVELFEDEGFRQEKLKLEEESKETNLKDNKAPQIQLDTDMLNDYGISITDEELQQINNNVNDTKKSDDVVVQNGKQLNDQPNVTQQNGQLSSQPTSQQQVVTTNGNNSCILENQLNESVELASELACESQVQSSLGESLTIQDWINHDKTKFDIQPLNRDLHITKAYKTAQIKAHEANEILNESIDEMYDLLKSRTKDELGVLGESFFIGRVNLDTSNTTDPKHKTLLLENPRLFQRKLKLDLSRISSYSLFPGKIVCFDGEIQPDTNNLIVNKFFDSELLLPPFNQTPIKLTTNTPIYLMAASGPISPSMSDDLSNLEHLLDQVKIFQPHYLILLGPFFDCRNDYLLFNCDGENFFNKIMKMISSSLENIVTEAIIVPSTFDLNNYNIFPAPPFEHTYPKIKFMPNPSFLNLNGISISLSSIDAIRHILKEEIKIVETNDVDRICEHLLVQKTLYPLYPPNPEVNLEYSKLDFIRFNVRPHLLILPTMHKNFVKNVHGSLFINPEYISKGVFTKIRIDCPPQDHKGPIVDYTKVENVKSKSNK